MDEKNRYVQKITPKSSDFSRWYVEVIRKAELADYAPMKGMMVIRPYGYAAWENIKDLMDKRIKETGHKNAYFPLFIPESFLKKETEHLEGFSPEVAWVTHGGEEELEERLAVRPTSEAIIGHMFSKWISSYRDLPVLINQWANIVRWEKGTRPFLRTSEFLWQEGHTAHETSQEAEEETLKMLSVYKEFVESELAISVISGKKTDREKFAGASATYSVEALMSDNKALQMGTSHFLGQHFSRVFDIKFEDRNQKLQYVWQTSWGVSTRMVGALIMAHGDDSGLCFPPRVAPVQVIIIPISIGDWKQAVMPVAEQIKKGLKQKGFRVEIDSREQFTPGWKFSEWEMKGVPLRLEIGPRDIKNNNAVLVRRDNRKKQVVSREELDNKVREILDDMQKDMLDRSLKFREDNTHEVLNYQEFKSVMGSEMGFIRTYWCGNPECELNIKEDTKATIRAIISEEKEGKCIYCGKNAGYLVVFAKAY
ncbi:MAG: proline--tRNA ligase [Candidatus Aminicenantes bacterium]|nr:proline--tRNA ligase [Candidatus Aminicenantes bacterium]